MSDLELRNLIAAVLFLLNNLLHHGDGPASMQAQRHLDNFQAKAEEEQPEAKPEAKPEVQPAEKSEHSVVESLGILGKPGITKG